MRKSILFILALALLLGASAPAFAISLQQNGLPEMLESILSPEEAKKVIDTLQNGPEQGDPYFVTAVPTRRHDAAANLNLVDYDFYLTPAAVATHAVTITGTIDAAPLVPGDDAATVSVPVTPQQITFDDATPRKVATFSAPESGNPTDYIWYANVNLVAILDTNGQAVRIESTVALPPLEGPDAVTTP